HLAKHLVPAVLLVNLQPVQVSYGWQQDAFIIAPVACFRYAGLCFHIVNLRLRILTSTRRSNYPSGKAPHDTGVNESFPQPEASRRSPLLRRRYGGSLPAPS